MDYLLIYKEDYPWDVRVEKIARTLNNAGWSGGILARNVDGNSRHEEHDGLKVFRLPTFGTLPRSVRYVLNFPFWFNPLWFISSLLLVRKNCVKVIVCRDLPLLKMAIFVGRVTGARVIYDMAECYPLMYESIRRHTKGKSIRGWLKSPNFAARYERYCVRRVHHIWAMIEESRDRLINEIGVPSCKVSIVSNTPEWGRIEDERADHSGTVVRIVYVGFLSGLRGLDLLIDGVSEFCRSGNRSNISLDIVGKGEERKRLESRIAESGLMDVVRLHGWLSQRDVNRLLALANVGALTYRKCSHWDHTIPNKIFDYMSAGLPVLGSEVTPISRIIRATKCGVICAVNDPVSIAEQLQILTDPKVRNEMGRNGRDAILSRYNWINDSEVLVSDVKRLM